MDGRHGVVETEIKIGRVLQAVDLRTHFFDVVDSYLPGDNPSLPSSRDLEFLRHDAWSLKLDDDIHIALAADDGSDRAGGILSGRVSQLFFLEVRIVLLT